MLIRRLVSSDALAFQAIRLAALRECPSAFSASYEEECGTPLATIEERLAPDSGCIKFGAFDEDELIGIAAIGRESARKLQHKAFIRGVYIAANHRCKGVGRQLLEQTLAFAESMPGVRQVTLAVTAGNAAAVALYESMGFNLFGYEPGALLVDGVLHDEIQLVRDVQMHRSFAPGESVHHWTH
jgi:ribosomal protein S18 acetylase RimI-like enzyme